MLRIDEVIKYLKEILEELKKIKPTFEFEKWTNKIGLTEIIGCILNLFLAAVDGTCAAEKL